MELTYSAKRRKRPKVESVSRIQLYLYPPTEDITLDEFEEYAIKRQKLLREISNMREKCSRGDIDKELYRKHMRDAIKPLGLEKPEGRRMDHISHFILRLAYCKSEEQRRWFLSQEVELFKHKLITGEASDITEFVENHKKYLPFEREIIHRRSDTANEQEKSFASDLWLFYRLSISDSSVEFYKVDFTQVLDLVQRRSVVVRKGYAYFPVSSKDMLISLVCNKFRMLLSQDLAKTAMFTGVVNDDQRIAPLLDNLKDQYFGTDFSNAASKLNQQLQLHQIDQYAKESFPPCMRHLHESLRTDHHLKHFGRLQYGLFLKSIGLTLDEAMAFWRDEFTKKMEVDKFDKQYAYNVRHSYGQEGKRANYTPYSCVRIITGNAPGTGDNHGCPFRHWDHTHIEEKMLSYGIPQKHLSKITEYTGSSHYQLACQKYFEIVHGLSQSNFSLEHPSQYYYESRRVRCGNCTGTTDTNDHSTATNTKPVDCTKEGEAMEEDYKWMEDETMLAEITNDNILMDTS